MNIDLLFILGGDISFVKYEDLEAAFAKQEIHPGDLKNAVEIYIDRLLDPIRKEFETNSKLKILANKAYPPPQKQSNLFHEVTLNTRKTCELKDENVKYIWTIYRWEGD